jgi:uncharacterized protein YecT (DUF1311 family)
VKTGLDARKETATVDIAIRTFLANAVVWGGFMLAASAAYADPVGECQKVTATQVETGQCLEDTLTTVDAVLDSAFASAQAAADEIDSVTGRPAARPALERAQSAWFEFRNINCLVPAAMAAGASGSGHFTVGCQIEMARARTEELQATAHR